MKNTNSVLGAVMAVCILVAVQPAAAQAPFQWEVGGDYIDQTVSFRQSAIFDAVEFDSDSLSVSAQWFFEPVQVGSEPLERAPFVQRASSVTGSFLTADNNGTDFDALTFGTRYQFSENWFATGQLGRSETDFQFSDSTSTLYGVGVGYYVGDTSALTFAVLRRESAVLRQEEFGFGGDFSSTTYTLGFEHLGDLGASWQYGLDSSLVAPQGEFDSARINVGLTLYPQQNIGFGVDAQAFVEDSSDRGVAVGVFGRWFINDAWSVSGRFEDRDAIDSFEGVDDESFTLGVRYRF